jgi:hypothetical protein
MTLRRHALRAAGSAAMWLGYATALVSRAVERAEGALRPRRTWRPVRIGSLQVRVPPDWGDLETDPHGGLVIHSRKQKFRIDGDAVWYSSAVELRVRTPDSKPRSSNAPITETCRSIATRSGVVVLAMSIANGVGPSRRREALRVLASARVVHGP